jgi:hypothetical protein
MARKQQRSSRDARKPGTKRKATAAAPPPAAAHTNPARSVAARRR